MTYDNLKNRISALDAALAKLAGTGLLPPYDKAYGQAMVHERSALMHAKNMIDTACSLPSNNGLIARDWHVYPKGTPKDEIIRDVCAIFSIRGMEDPK